MNAVLAQRVVVERVETFSYLAALREEWDELWRRDPVATPFQSPAWLLPWWKHLGSGRLSACAVRGSGNKLIGLAPLYIYYDPQTNWRKLLPIGISTSDYLDVPCDIGSEARVASGVIEALSSAGEWDGCDWPQVHAESAMLRTLRNELTGAAVAESDPCVVLQLPQGHDQLADCVPANMLQNLRYYRRRAERVGRLTVEIADADNLEELKSELFRLHSMTWAIRGSPGVLSDPAVQHMHAQAIPELLRNGILRLQALRLSGRAIAMLYGMAAKGRFYYYLGGFDPQYKGLSPGTLLIGAAIERAIEEGCREFDFLRGREPYKYLWGAHDRRTYAIHLTRADCGGEGLA